MYFTILLSVHLLLCLSLIGLVLIQQGKGADMGAAFGGGSNTLFGASGAVNVITKVTTSVAILFMLTSILLVRAYSAGGYISQKVGADPLAGSVMDTVPEKTLDAVAGAGADPQVGATNNPASGPAAVGSAESKSQGESGAVGDKEPKAATVTNSAQPAAPPVQPVPAANSGTAQIPKK